MINTNELREVAKSGPLTTTVDSGLLYQVADEIDRLRGLITVIRQHSIRLNSKSACQDIYDIVKGE